MMQLASAMQRGWIAQSLATRAHVEPPFGRAGRRLDEIREEEEFRGLIEAAMHLAQSRRITRSPYEIARALVDLANHPGAARHDERADGLLAQLECLLFALIDSEAIPFRWLEGIERRRNVQDALRKVGFDRCLVFYTHKVRPVDARTRAGIAAELAPATPAIDYVRAVSCALDHGQQLPRPPPLDGLGYSELLALERVLYDLGTESCPEEVRAAISLKQQDVFRDLEALSSMSDPAFMDVVAALADCELPEELLAHARILLERLAPDYAQMDALPPADRNELQVAFVRLKFTHGVGLIQELAARDELLARGSRAWPTLPQASLRGSLCGTLAGPAQPRRK